MLAIAVAICLTHQGLAAIVLAFHEAVRNAGRQKLEKRQDFLSPIYEVGKRFAQGIRPVLVHF
jgi:hypothetical protein